MLAKKKKLYKVELKRRLGNPDNLVGGLIWEANWTDITEYFLERLDAVATSLDDATLQGKIEQASVSLQFNNVDGKFNPQSTENSLWETIGYIYHSRIRLYEFFEGDDYLVESEEPTLLPLIDGLIAEEPKYRADMKVDIRVNSKLDILREHYILDNVTGRIKRTSSQAVISLIIDLFKNTYSELDITAYGGLLRSEIIYDDITNYGDSLLSLLYRIIADAGSLGGLNRDNEFFCTYLGSSIITQSNFLEHTQWTLLADTLTDTTIMDLLEYSVDSKVYGVTSGTGTLVVYDTSTDAWIEKAPQLGSATTMYNIIEFNNKIYSVSNTGNLYEWDGTSIWVSKSGVSNSVIIREVNSEIYGARFNSGGLGGCVKWDGASAWINAVTPAASWEFEFIEPYGGGANCIYGSNNSARTNYRLYTWDGTGAAPVQVATNSGVIEDMILDTDIYYQVDTGYLKKWNGVAESTISSDALPVSINKLVVHGSYFYAITTNAKMYRVLKVGGAWEYISSLGAYTGDTELNCIIKGSDSMFYIGTKSTTGQLITTDANAVHIYHWDENDYNEGGSSPPANGSDFVYDKLVPAQNLSVLNETISTYSVAAYSRWLSSGFVNYSSDNFYSTWADYSTYSFSLIYKNVLNRNIPNVNIAASLVDVTSTPYTATQFSVAPILMFSSNYTQPTNNKLAPITSTLTTYSNTNKAEGFALNEKGELMYIHIECTTSANRVPSWTLNYEVILGNILGENFVNLIGINIDGTNNTIEFYLNGKVQNKIVIDSTYLNNFTKARIIGCSYPVIFNNNYMYSLGLGYYSGFKFCDYTRTQNDYFNEYKYIYGSEYSI